MSSPITRAWWWALDYLYAGYRQVAVLAPPWTFGMTRPTPAAWRAGSDALPELVLIPGVYEHWTFIRPLGSALSAAGYRVRVVHGLGTNRRAVIDTANRLALALGRTPAPPAGRILVAHSKGGLIGKQLLVSSAAAAAATSAGTTIPGATTSAPLGLLGLVAICTPFQGSRRARLLLGDPSIRAFLPTDQTIVSLGRESSVNGRIVSIFGRYDPHIPDGSALDGATNVQVPGVGHFRMLGDPATHRAVQDAVALLAS